MPAEEALIYLDEILQQKEIEAYNQAMTIWAIKTQQCSAEIAEECMPLKPLCLCDDYGD